MNTFNSIMKKVAIIAIVICLLALGAEYILANQSEKLDVNQYGDWYVGGTKFGETRVHDAQGNYIGSIFGDPEMSRTYYWWVPEDSEITFENALKYNYINAVWTNEKFNSMFGSDIIVGCEPNHESCGGYEDWLNE